MLYFIATPIGNLKDISLRAIETLKSVDVIACEDTRKSMILLNHYEIKKRLLAYHKNNEFTSANGIIKLLQEGKNVAVISDCGMPVISDPGNILVNKLIENNLEYSIIPGANAGLSALVLSGFNAERFSFIGFLPEKNKDKEDVLSNFKNLPYTTVFYVSPHNFKDIESIYKIFGNRKACLVNEITKVFEKTIFFELNNIPEIEPRGEYVLIIEGKKEVQNELENLTLSEQIDFYIDSGLTKKEALKKVAKANNIKNIYKVLEENWKTNIKLFIKKSSLARDAFFYNPKLYFKMYFVISFLVTIPTILLLLKTGTFFLWVSARTSQTSSRESLILT